MLVDTHTHLNFAAFAGDWQEVVKRAISAGVEKMVVVGTDVATSKKAVEMAEAHPALWAAVGIHPHHAKQFTTSNLQFSMQDQLQEIERLSRHEKVVAVGEIGLDKHEYKNTRYKMQDASGGLEEVWEIQKKLLREQLALAGKLNKPVILHSRDLRDEVLKEIHELRIKNQELRGVFHCFEGSRKYLRRILESGFYVSFTGNITFVPDRAVVAGDVPLERLLLETDSPYMTPEPDRGLRNTPEHVTIIAKHHANQRKIQFDEVADATTKNALELFGLHD